MIDLWRRVAYWLVVPDASWPRLSFLGSADSTCTQFLPFRTGGQIMWVQIHCAISNLRKQMWQDLQQGQSVLKKFNLWMGTAANHIAAGLDNTIIMYPVWYEDSPSLATGGGNGCREGGRDGTEWERCLLLPGLGPSELKRRTATSRSVGRNYATS